MSEFGSGPILPTSVHDEDAVAAVLAKLGEHAEPVAAALAELPEIAHASEYDWSARQAEGRRWRECFALTDADADAARAFGCLLELSGRNGRSHAYVTDPEWLADRLVEKIAAHATAAAERKQPRERRAPPGSIGGRSREGGAAAGAAAAVRGARRPPARATSTSARRSRSWQPKLDADAVKLLGSIVLQQHGKAAAWAHRLCVEQPSTANKQGKVTVRYPRGAEAERKLHAEATDALRRARTPEDALAVVLRLLVAQRLVDTAGLPNADRQGVYEPRELAASPTLDKLARRVAPASVKQHLAEQEAEREQREQAWRDEQEARLQRAARQARRWRVRPLRVLPRPDRVRRRRDREARRLVHSGDCEQQWGSADRRGRGGRRMTHRPSRLSNLNSTRDTDALDP